MERKKKVGFYEFTGCAGDLLTIVHNEDYLLKVWNSAEIVSFRLASSQRSENTPLDLAFVEGSITAEEQVEELKKIREKSKILVALGTCAAFGGLQAMYSHKKDFLTRFNSVYPQKFNILKPLDSKPLEAYVKVDYYIPGCPIDFKVFLYNYTRLLNDIPGELPSYPVCLECKWRENDCLLLKKIPCLGPLTRAGCEARCPTNNLPCVGCFGPYEDANISSWLKIFQENNIPLKELEKKIRLFWGVKANIFLNKIKKQK
mgnify:CR=1 FL=1